MVALIRFCTLHLLSLIHIYIDLTGVILKNRYCIISQIGKGGQGTMYLARDMELGTFWAIKQLPLSMKKEAELLRRLNHSSLPRMTDYTEQDLSLIHI